MPPENVPAARLKYFKTAGVFSAVSGVLVGKPMDRGVRGGIQKAALAGVIADDRAADRLQSSTSATRCRAASCPFGVEAAVDVNGQKITFG